MIKGNNFPSGGGIGKVKIDGKKAKNKMEFKTQLVSTLFHNGWYRIPTNELVTHAYNVRGVLLCKETFIPRYIQIGDLSSLDYIYDWTVASSSNPIMYGHYYDLQNGTFHTYSEGLQNTYLFDTIDEIITQPIGKTFQCFNGKTCQLIKNGKSYQFLIDDIDHFADLIEPYFYAQFDYYPINENNTIEFCTSIESICYSSNVCVINYVYTIQSKNGEQGSCSFLYSIIIAPRLVTI